MNTPIITKETTARDSVEIILQDGSIYSGKRGMPVGEFLKALPENEFRLITGAVVNGELRELTYPIDMDPRVRPLSMSDYRRRAHLSPVGDLLTRSGIRGSFPGRYG